jgi:Phage integrase family
MLSLPLSWVERALLRTLLAGRTRSSIFSQLQGVREWGLKQIPIRPRPVFSSPNLWVKISLLSGQKDVGHDQLTINGRGTKSQGFRHYTLQSLVEVVPGAKAPRNKDPRRTFEAAVKESGILNFRYHDIRHTFASRLVMAGVDLRTVQELMGHKTVAMTIRYSHLAPSHQREAIERLVSVPSQRAPKIPTDTRTDTSDFQVNSDSTLQTEQVH